MTTSEHYQSEARRYQRDLEYFDALGLPLLDADGRDITQEHRQHLTASRDEYLEAADIWAK